MDQITKNNEALIDFSEKFEGWDDPNRYKVAYGGRGSGKSWQVARNLIIRTTQEKLLIVCGREIQKSIEESVKRLIEQQIEMLGVSNIYTSNKNKITAANGSEFIFVGLRHNIQNIKGIEGADIVWIEEANTISAESWNTLVPTVRKEGSEIWITFNPHFEEDVVYKEFVENAAQYKDAHIINVNWNDNPWFPKPLQDERKRLLEFHPDLERHIYGGELLTNVSDSIFKNEMFGRYERVPYLKRIGLYADTAQSTSDQAAYSVFIAAGVNDSGIYILDVLRGRYDADALKDAAIHFWKNHKDPKITNPAPMAMRIEDKASGIGLNQQLKNRGIPVQVIKRTKTKVGSSEVEYGHKWERAQRATMKLEGKKIYLPTQATPYTDSPDWAHEYKTELLKATIRGDGVGYWDQVDPTADAINDMMNISTDIFVQGIRKHG